LRDDVMVGEGLDLERRGLFCRHDGSLTVSSTFFSTFFLRLAR
jgi:hypothetical protein